MIFTQYPLILWARDGLRDLGIEVTASDMPGLYNVSGHPELTTGQVIDLARQKGIFDKPAKARST